MLHTRFLALLPLAVACSDTSEGPAPVVPDARSGSTAAEPERTELVPVEGLADREGALDESADSAPEGPVEVVPLDSVKRHVKELQTSVAAYRDLPDSERTDHLTDQYHHELLELGRELARLAAEADADGAPYYRHMATGVLEELAFDAGEDSEFCVRAYEELADLARDAGRAEDVDTFEEALQRLVDEKDG